MIDFEPRFIRAKRLQFEWNKTQRKIAVGVIPTVLFALKDKPDAGRLRDSIGFRLEASGPLSTTIRFVSTAPYAGYVIEGTRGTNTITPSTPGVMALRWVGPSGDYMFASAVQRKPTPPNAFNYRVALAMEATIMQRLPDSIIITLE